MRNMKCNASLMHKCFHGPHNSLRELEHCRVTLQYGTNLSSLHPAQDQVTLFG